MMSHNANNIRMTDSHRKNSLMSESCDATQNGVTVDKEKDQPEPVNLSNSHDQHGRNYQAHVSHSGEVSTSTDLLSKTVSVSEEVGQIKKHKMQTTKKPALVHPAETVTSIQDPLKISMCSLCQAVFSHFADLLAHHKTIHSSDTSHPFRCSACGRIQTSETGLTYHQVYICKMVERPHQCDNCLLRFQSEEMVDSHKCSGCPIKKYACELCDHYRTDSSRDLEKHMRIHTNDKCFVCRVCGFSTAWKKNLKDHMIKHLGLKPYVCDLCEYSSSDRHSLRSHKMKHDQNGEVRFGGECNIKKRKLVNSSIMDSSDPDTCGGSGRVLECPFSDCVYHTELEYMMTNHILMHQGAVKHKLDSSDAVGVTCSNRREANPEDSSKCESGKIGRSGSST